MLWKLIRMKVAALLMMLLIGCQQEWHVTITGVEAGAAPRFCVTKHPACTGDGVWISIFAVLPIVDPVSWKTGKPVWWIESDKEGASLREFVYGITPPGYKQVIPPMPLQPGRIYQVGDYWFRLKEAEGKLSCEVARMGQLR
jgi:hypothetical protein